MIRGQEGKQTALEGRAKRGREHRISHAGTVCTVNRFMVYRVGVCLWHSPNRQRPCASERMHRASALKIGRLFYEERLMPYNQR